MINMKKWILYLTIVVLVVVRFMYLDQDAPSYMIGGICQEDEQYYTLEAINRYNEDNGRLVEGFEHVYAGGLTLYSLPLTYTTLKLIGNNYWGFRISVVLLSLLTILMLFDIIRKLTNNKILIQLLVLYMFTDFYFYLFSRFQTPQIYAIFSITLVIWMYFKFTLNTAKGAFLVGLFSLFTVLFVYLYNMFIVGVFGLLVLNVCYLNKSIKPVLYFIMGSIISVVAYLISLKIIDSPLTENINLVFTHGGGVDAGNKHSGTSTDIMLILKNLYSRLIQLPVTNIFRYNLSAMFLFFFSLPYIIYVALRLKSERALFYILFFIFLTLQSLFVLSYPFKKLIIVFPLVVVVLADCLPNALSYYSDVNKRAKLWLSGYGIFIMLLGAINFKLNNSRAYWEGFNYGYYDNTSIVFNTINVLFLAITVFLILIFIVKRRIETHRILVLPSFLGLFLIAQYCLLNKTFYSRDGFKDSSRIINDKKVALSSCYASQFYTTSKPFMGHYADRLIIGDEAYYKKGDSLFKSGLAEYTIDKIMPGKISRYENRNDLIKVLEIPMKYYSFNVYKYVGEQTNELMK